MLAAIDDRPHVDEALAKLKIFEVNPITSHPELQKLSLQVGGKTFRTAHENVPVAEVTDIICSEVALLFRTNERHLQVYLLRCYALEFIIVDGIAPAVNAVVEPCLIRAILRLLDVARPAQKRRDTDARGDPDLPEATPPDNRSGHRVPPPLHLLRSGAADKGRW